MNYRNLLLMVALVITLALPSFALDNNILIVKESGSEIRLLQLEKQITWNIMLGEEIIADLNSPEAEELLAKLVSLKDEIKTMDMNKSEDELASDFVLIRDEAKKTISDFKLLIKDLTQEQKEIIKEKVGNKDKSELDDIENEIKTKRQKYEYEKAKELLAKLNINDESLNEKIANGTATYGDIRSTISHYFVLMSKEEKKEAILALQEIKVKQKVMQDKVKEKMEQRKKEFREKVEKKVKTKIQDMKAKWDEKKKQIGEKMYNKEQKKECDGNCKSNGKGNGSCSGSCQCEGNGICKNEVVEDILAPEDSNEKKDNNSTNSICSGENCPSPTDVTTSPITGSDSNE